MMLLKVAVCVSILLLTFLLAKNLENRVSCESHRCVSRDLEQRIPKVIWRIWLSDSGSDDNPFRNAWEYTSRHNPEYTQVLLKNGDVERYMKERWRGPVCDAFQSICPSQMAARSDLVRYCLLYDVGGVYLDCKSSMRSLCTVVLPHDGMLVTTWPTIIPGPNAMRLNRVSGEYLQWWIACAPGNPLMLRVIERVVNELGALVPNTPSGGKLGILKATGPIAFTSAIRDSVGDPRLMDMRVLCVNASGILKYDHAGGYRRFGKRYDDTQKPLVCPDIEG
jgi:mannosyltransferase OCH1-like enzyme